MCPVEANNYIVTESFIAKHHILSPLVNNILLFAFIMGITILLTISTTLKKIWYAAASTLFVVVLACLKLDFLLLFGLTNQAALGIALFIYLGPSYYFNQIRPDVPVINRFFVFTGVTVFYLALCFFFAKGTHPAYYISHYGLSAFIIISFGFIIMIAHENIIGLVNLFTNVLKPGKAFINFLIIGLAYLTMLVLLFFKQQLFFLPGPFFIFGVSSLVGFWGFKKQSTLPAIYF